MTYSLTSLTRIGEGSRPMLWARSSGAGLGPLDPVKGTLVDTQFEDGPVPTGLCTRAQSMVHENMDDIVWCVWPWLVYTESWPQPKKKKYFCDKTEESIPIRDEARVLKWVDQHHVKPYKLRMEWPLNSPRIKPGEQMLFAIQRVPDLLFWLSHHSILSYEQSKISALKSICPNAVITQCPSINEQS